MAPEDSYGATVQRWRLFHVIGWGGSINEFHDEVLRLFFVGEVIRNLRNAWYARVADYLVLSLRLARELQSMHFRKPVVVSL